MELWLACVSPSGQEDDPEPPSASPSSKSFNFEPPSGRVSTVQEVIFFEQLAALFAQSGEHTSRPRPSSEVTIRTLCREAEDEDLARRIERSGREAAVASINRHLDEYLLQGSSGDISCKCPGVNTYSCPSFSSAPHGSHRLPTPHSRGLDLADPPRKRRATVEREQ